MQKQAIFLIVKKQLDTWKLHVENGWKEEWWYDGVKQMVKMDQKDCFCGGCFYVLCF